jgi:hypothetical protein
MERRHWMRLLVVLYTIVVWVVLVLVVTNCGGDSRTGLDPAAPGDTVQIPEPPIRWEMAIVVGDSMRLPLRWRAVCDHLGCPDAFRLEYTQRHKDSSIAANVPIRSVRVTATADTATVRMPLLGQPQAVCVAIRSERRGLLSVPTGNCRLVETPDVPPPPPDSIDWGAMGVVRDAAAAGIEWDWPRSMTRMAKVQYLLDASGVVQDSAPVPGEVDWPSALRPVNPGWTVRLCSHRRDTQGRLWVVVPKASAWDTTAIRQFQRECGTTVTGTPRWVLDSITFTPIPN